MKKKATKKKVTSKTTKQKSKVAKKVTKKTSKVAKKKVSLKPKAKITKKTAKPVQSKVSKPKTTPEKPLIQQKSQAQISSKPQAQAGEKYQSFYSKYQTYYDQQKQNTQTNQTNQNQPSQYSNQPRPDIQQKAQTSQSYTNKPELGSQTLGQRNPVFFQEAFKKTNLIDQSKQNNLPKQGSINKPATNFNQDSSKKGFNK